MPKVTNRDRFGNLIDVDQMIKRFKKELAKEGVLDDIKRHEYFLPARLARKRKSEKHQQLLRKLNKKSQKQQY